LRTTYAIGGNEPLIDYVDIRCHLNNLGLSQQAVDGQGIDLRAAFNEVCRSIDVRA
jgi:hypothetical protein